MSILAENGLIFLSFSRDMAIPSFKEVLTITLFANLSNPLTLFLSAPLLTKIGKSFPTEALASLRSCILGASPVQLPVIIIASAPFCLASRADSLIVLLESKSLACFVCISASISISSAFNSFLTLRTLSGSAKIFPKLVFKLSTKTGTLINLALPYFAILNASSKSFHSKLTPEDKDILHSNL